MFTIIFVVIFGLACGVKSWIGFADNAFLNKDWLLKYLKVDLLPSRGTKLGLKCIIFPEYLTWTSTKTLRRTLHYLTY